MGPRLDFTHMSSEVTRHIKEPVQLRGIEFFHTGIKSEGVLGCIGFETGVIKEILDKCHHE
jgi:hypothetical protein